MSTHKNLLGLGAIVIAAVAFAWVTQGTGQEAPPEKKPSGIDVDANGTVSADVFDDVPGLAPRAESGGTPAFQLGGADGPGHAEPPLPTKKRRPGRPPAKKEMHGPGRSGGPGGTPMNMPGMGATFGGAGMPGRGSGMPGTSNMIAPPGMGMSSAGITSMGTGMMGMMGASPGEQPLEAQASQLIVESASVEDAENREQLREQAVQLLNDAFDIRHARQVRELEELERRVVRLRQTLDRRQEMKEEIVASRLEHIVREAEGMGWGNSDSSGGPHPGGIGLRK